jgi:hypothetical protein
LTITIRVPKLVAFQFILLKNTLNEWQPLIF